MCKQKKCQTKDQEKRKLEIWVIERKSLSWKIEDKCNFSLHYSTINISKAINCYCLSRD